MRSYRITQEDAGTKINRHAARSFTEIILAAEACLNAVDKHMKRLFKAGLGMMAALWSEAVAPNSVTRLAHWLEADVHHLHAWRVSAARAGADLALWFIMS